VGPAAGVAAAAAVAAEQRGGGVESATSSDAEAGEFEMSGDFGVAWGEDGEGGDW